MKCDNLETEQWLNYGGEPMPCYAAKDVDEAVAELKKEIERCQRYHDAEAVKWLAETAKTHADLRKTQRALWLARAERAHSIILVWNVYCYQNNSLYYRDFMNVKCNPFRNLPKKTAMEWSDLWESIETKLRTKAKEYK